MDEWIDTQLSLSHRSPYSCSCKLEVGLLAASVLISSLTHSFSVPFRNVSSEDCRDLQVIY